jgi:hypothetical protein
MVSTTSQSLPVNNPTFQVLTRILLASASFLTLCIHRVKCEDPYPFFTKLGRRRSTSLKMRQLVPCSFNIVSRSRYGASLRGWQSGPCPFNIIPEFRYDASLIGLHPNDFLCGFISIGIAKIVVNSPSLIQPLLPDLDRLC